MSKHFLDWGDEIRSEKREEGRKIVRCGELERKREGRGKVRMREEKRSDRDGRRTRGRKRELEGR